MLNKVFLISITRISRINIGKLELNDDQVLHNLSIRLNDNTKSNTSDKANRTLFINDLLKKWCVHLSDLFNEKQREKLRTLSKDEKKKNQCKTCGIYFHRTENCMFKTQFCYNGFRFGHSNQTYTEGVSYISINSIRSLPKANNTRSLSIFDVNTMNPETNDKHFRMNTTFIVDSGAIHHVVSNQTILHHFRQYIYPIEEWLTINDAPVIATFIGYGNILVLIWFGKLKYILRVMNVQLVTNFNENVLSVRKFNLQFHSAFNLNTNNGSIYSRKAKMKIGMIRITNDLYLLNKQTDRFIRSSFRLE